MEFKGTKGKWVINEMDRYSRLINIESDEGKKICETLCGNESHPDRQDAEFNALLISKAPEMLQMLIEISKTAERVWETNEENEFFDEIDFAELDDLIKEATEI